MLLQMLRDSENVAEIARMQVFFTNLVLSVPLDLKMAFDLYDF